MGELVVSALVGACRVPIPARHHFECFVFGRGEAKGGFRNFGGEDGVFDLFLDAALFPYIFRQLNSIQHFNGAFNSRLNAGFPAR